MADTYLKDIVKRKGYVNTSTLVGGQNFVPRVVRRIDASMVIDVEQSNDAKLEWLYAEDENGVIIEWKRFAGDSTEGKKDLEVVEKRSLELSSKRLQGEMENITPFAVWHSERTFKGETVANKTVCESELQEKFEWARKTMAPKKITGDPSIDSALQKVSSVN
jgi:hypothetical protein|tara:strand:- start:92 stop:580 length:489 start_codon:yes stop_codon:yes gene_type:complete